MAGLAGCLNAQSDDGPALISRVHTMTLDSSSEEVYERHDGDMQAVLRELLHTDLVVRVQEAGDYTLEYTDTNGAIQTQALSGLSPGSPRTVSGVDPLAPAVLKQGGDVLFTRGGLSGDWWAVGDIPLGFNMTEGAAGIYAIESLLEESIELEDLNVEQQGITVSTASFRLLFPLDGEVSYDLGTEGADGAPLTLAATMEIRPSAGDLASLEVDATMNGEPGTAGFIAGVDEARASGQVRTWWQGGQPVAAQFLGGEWSAKPRVTAWADGFFAELAEGQSCAGKSKADRCEPEELQAQTDTLEAGEKETIAADDLPRLSAPENYEGEREELQKFIDALRVLFAQDVVRGDKLTVTFQADQDDLGSSGPGMVTRMDFVMEAAADEEIEVPAGTFQTLKITEEMRTQLRVDEYTDPGTGETYLRDFEMDEIVARYTFWLEEGTNRPVKMEASTPLNVDALLKRMVNSLSASAWDQLGGKPIDNSDWSITAKAESSYEAKELTGATHYSALAGLALAHAIASSSSGPLTWATEQAGGGYSEATEVYAGDAYYEDGNMTVSTPYPVRPRGEPVSLSMSSAGPIQDGVKTYRIESASGGLTYGSLMLTLDGTDAYPYYEGEDACVPPAQDEWNVCRDGVPVMPWETIQAGDELSIAATPGATLRVLDGYTNSVILSLVVS